LHDSKLQLQSTSIAHNHPFKQIPDLQKLSPYFPYNINKLKSKKKEWGT